MPVRACLKVAALKIFKTVVFSQLFIIAVLVAKSAFPYFDILPVHISKLVVEPYLQLLWSSLTQWRFIYYISVPLPLIVLVKRHVRGSRGGFRSFLSKLSVLLLMLIGLSQAFILSIIIITSVVPFLDQLITHIYLFIVKPYFALLWSTLSSWLSVYFSVVLIVLYYVKHKVGWTDTHTQEIEVKLDTPALPKPFLPRCFFPIFYDKLSQDCLANLCHELIALEDGFNLTESTEINNISGKGDKLMKILILLEGKSNGQDLLVKALQRLFQRSGPRNWYDYLLEKVLKNDYSEDSPVATCQASSSLSSVSIKVLDTIFQINQTDNESTFGWPSLNDIIQFRLSKGWITAELISSPHDITVPPNSEVVSPMFRVYASHGAQVSLDVLHCVQSVDATNSSNLSFATVQVHSSTVYPLRLKSSSQLNSSFKDTYGTLKLQQQSLEPCPCLIGCIVLHPGHSSPSSTGIIAPSSTDMVAPTKTAASVLSVRYSYSVFYELVDVGKEIDLKHWKVHIIPYKDLIDFHEQIIKSKFPPQEYLYENEPKQPIEVTDGNLSLAIPHSTGRHWIHKKHETLMEDWDGMQYQHYIVDIEWRGQDGTFPKDFKQKFEWNGTSKRTRLRLFLSPRKEYEALLRFHTSKMSTSKVFLKKLTGLTRAGIKLCIPAGYT